MVYLTQANDIRASITQFSSCQTLWLDTEVADWKTANPRLSLIQVLANPDDLTGDGVYILDVLNQSELVKYFIDQIMVNINIEKVFHNSSYDIRFLGKNQAQNVICTLKMARKISLDDLGTSNLKLKTLARELCGFSDVSEKEGTSDWGRRPLTTRQLHYAKMDVVYQAQVHLYLSRWLKANGQSSLPLKYRSLVSGTQNFSSTSLPDKCQQLIEISQKKNTLQKYANNLRHFQSRQKQICQAVAEIDPLVNALRLFRQKSIFTVDLTYKLEPLLKFISEAEENFKENSGWILDNNNFKENIFKSSVKELTKTLRQQLLEAWINYLAKKMPSTNQEMLNILGKVDAFKPTVQTIRNLDALIPREEFPKSLEEFDNIDRLIGQLKESWQSLSSDEVPEAVLRFLRAAASQGAPLTLLTPDVQEWIAHQGISDSLRIRLTSKF